ncbi:MAG: PAS domain S-box protein [Gammaproteobacteria bacterium]
MSEAPPEHLHERRKTEILHQLTDRTRVLLPALVLVVVLSVLHGLDVSYLGWILITATAVVATLFYIDRPTRSRAAAHHIGFHAITQSLDSLTQVLPGASFHLPVEAPTEHAYVSEGAEDIYDIPTSEIGSLADLDRHISLIDRDTTHALRNESLAHAEPWELVYRVTVGEAETRWIWECGRPYRAADANVYAVGILLDVTAWHRMEQRFDTLLTAIEHIAHELYVVDTETLEFLYVNRATLDNLQYSEDEIRELTPADLGGRSASELDDELAPLRDGSVMELRLEDVLTRKDGTTYPISLTITLVPFDRREAYMAIGADISEQLEQQEKLRLSEERYQLAVLGSNDGVWHWDAETNDFSISVQGQPPPWSALEGESTFESFMARIHPDDQRKVMNALTTYQERRDEFSVEFRFRTSDDTYRWIHTRGQAVWNDEGRPLRMAGCFSDVTSRKESETLLHDTVNRLGAVLWNVADGIITFDDYGRIYSFNPAAERIFECGEHEVVGLPITDLIPMPEEHDDDDHDWINVWGGESEGLRREGGRFPLELAVSKMPVSGERMYTAVMRDISERKKVEQALVEAKDKAEAAARTKTEFLATMSHEIRTPMNGVLGMTQLLLDMQLDREQRDIAEMIYSSGESLLSIINDVLDFSKIEAGKLSLEAVPFDLRATIGDVTALMSGKALERGLELLVDYPSDVPYRLIGDVGRIRQVLVNLVGNAVKFTDEGHVVTRVVLKSLELERARVQIVVEDTGIGVDPADQERLFDAFTQADASTTRRFGGTGLGLAICRQLTNLMGGEIGVESIKGEGSKFWFTLELELDQSQPDEEMPNRIRGLHALVVDDNPMGRRIFHHMLRELEMTVVSVDSGGLAMEALREAHADGHPFDVALLDFHMPEMDGETLLTKIRADESLNSLRLIMLTSSGQIGERERLYDLGIDGYLLKPVLFQSLTRELLRVYGSPRISNTRTAKAPPTPQLEGLQVLPVTDGMEATGRMREIEARSGRSRTPIIAMTANAMEGDAERCFAAGMDDYAAKPVKKEILRAILTKWRERIAENAS